MHHGKCINHIDYIYKKAAKMSSFSSESILFFFLLLKNIIFPY